MDRTIGVLGGMGPQATVDFFQKVVNNTPASCDQEHIHLIIDNDPKTPDRTGYILGEGDSPLRALISRAIRLQMMGADFLVMPCNTAHYYYHEIVKYISVPFINMIDEVAREIESKYGAGTRAGLLATLGTYEGRVYNSVLERYGIDVVVPDDSGKKAVYNLIYKIKEDLNNAEVNEVAEVVNDLKNKGASIIILGCTELPLIEKKLPADMVYLDSTLVLAQKAVEAAKGGFDKK